MIDLYASEKYLKLTLEYKFLLVAARFKKNKKNPLTNPS